MQRPAIRLIVRGRVQGVGFRWWTIRAARALGLDGWVRNRRDGAVEVLVIGEQVAAEKLAQACARGPAGAAVAGVERAAAEDDGSIGFSERPTA
jgi:acylphosphatase